MKRESYILITTIFILLFPATNFGQIPDLGAASNFALFTTSGEFKHDGATYIAGDIGTYEGTSNGFSPEKISGQIHVADTTSAKAAKDIKNAYKFLSNINCGKYLGNSIGNNEILLPNVYCLKSSSILTGDLILNGLGNPNAFFIFKIEGSLTSSSFSNIILINSASACNVYWQVSGAFNLGEHSVFKGTIITDGDISLLDYSSVLGRCLSCNGAIYLHKKTLLLFESK